MSASEQFLILLEGDTPPSAALIQAYLNQADALILGYLGVATLPVSERMDDIRAMLALTLYNRRGAEGESARTEGEVTSRFSPIPDSLCLLLRPFRSARAVSLLKKAGEN